MEKERICRPAEKDLTAIPIASPSSRNDAFHRAGNMREALNPDRRRTPRD
jgi:hypothetical protein